MAWSSLSVGCSLKGHFSINHSFDTVVHVLDEVLLRTAKSALVGDIEDAVRGIRVLTTGATDLDVVLVSDTLESGPVIHELLQADVDRSAEGCSEVSRAGCDITEMAVVSELGSSLDSGSGTAEALEDGTDVGTLLHGDDTELILLINPDEEGLGVIVEDTSALGPVAVETAGIEEAIALPRIKGAKSVRLLI